MECGASAAQIVGVDPGRPAVPYESRDPAEIQRVSSATKGEELVDDEKEKLASEMLLEASIA